MSKQGQFLDINTPLFFYFGGISFFKISTALKEINIILDDVPFYVILPHETCILEV